MPRRTALVLCLAAALFAGAGLVACSGGGQFAKEMATSFGEGALEGFSNHVEYEYDEWGRAYEPSGRGVVEAGAVGTRAVRPPFDCTNVKDEYDRLYDFTETVSPTANLHHGSLTEAEYEGIRDKGGIRLDGEHRGGVIALLNTSAGNRARFVMHWTAAGLSMRDLVVYDAEGKSIHEVVGPMELPIRFAADIDPIGEGAGSGESGGFDILFGPDSSGEVTFATPRGAGISFPTDSLCP
jgi:hypothetical protein